MTSTASRLRRPSLTGALPSAPRPATLVHHRPARRALDRRQRDLHHGGDALDHDAAAKAHARPHQQRIGLQQLDVELHDPDLGLRGLGLHEAGDPLDHAGVFLIRVRLEAQATC